MTYGADYTLEDAIKDVLDNDHTDDEPGICPACSGSGEGQYEGSTCRQCHGKGED